jgi:predicted membrane protein
MPVTFRTVLAVVLALILVGVALWLVNAYVPMARSINAILNIVVVLATCVGVLQALGLWPSVVRLWSDLTGRRIFRS